MQAAPKMVLDFSPTGQVQGMHRDVFPLGFLGKQTITRASDIVHDADSDTWTITVAVGSTFVNVAGADGFATYDSARRMEVRWFEMCRLHGVSPVSEEGGILLKALRSKMD